MTINFKSLGTFDAESLDVYEKKLKSFITSIDPKVAQIERRIVDVNKFVENLKKGHTLTNEVTDGYLTKPIADVFKPANVVYDADTAELIQAADDLYSPFYKRVTNPQQRMQQALYLIDCLVKTKQRLRLERQEALITLRTVRRQLEDPIEFKNLQKISENTLKRALFAHTNSQRGRIGTTNVWTALCFIQRLNAVYFIGAPKLAPLDEIVITQSDSSQNDGTFKIIKKIADNGFVIVKITDTSFRPLDETSSKASISILKSEIEFDQVDQDAQGIIS